MPESTIAEEIINPLDFRDLLESRWKTLPQKELIYWITGLWHIWYQRNRIVNGKRCQDPKADVDGDETLNYGEFVVVSVHLRKMANDEHLHKAFAFFDRNQSGYIEVDELRDALSDEWDANSEEVINTIMHDVDTDEDGRITNKVK
ncbi:non-receptor serine/threonine protein kinase [Lithospermum erythrorhizon]|uniref:Non-receptor serine/threonine protein kinase n=1 Tax=Lithospermum erythrorhizon TaxID=34254 RepID=A0AAV3P7I6_LITER